MRSTQIKKFLPYIIFILFVMILSACGNAEETGKEDAGKESAEEKVFGVDFMEELRLQNVWQIVCTQNKAWAITSHKDGFIYQLYDTGTEGITELEWRQGEGESLLDISEYKGTLYSAVQITSNDSIEIRKQVGSARWDTIMTIEAQDAEWEWYTVGGGLYVDGSENAYLVSESTVTRFNSDGRRVLEYRLDGKIGFFQENSEGYVECVTAGAEGITLYALKEDKEEEIWTLKETASRICGIPSSEEDLLCMASQEALLFIDRASGSLQARTDLVMLGVSSVMGGMYNASNESLRLYGSTSDFGGVGNIFCSLLSGREASAENRTELVYGTTRSTPTSSVREAILEFNRENKDYYITIKSYHDDIPYQGLLRLHADMASGDAPDILGLSETWMDYYESYVRNGYLENLSPYLEQSEYRDDILWNVLNTYQVDGSLYCLAPQFSVQGLMIHPDYAVSTDEWNMDTFLGILEKNQWEKAPFYIYGGEPASLLRIMLSGRQEEFIDREKKSAAFETEEFTNLLALCKEYGEQDWSNQEELTYEERQLHTICETTAIHYFLISYLGDVDVYGREYRIYGYPASSGQVYPIETCPDCVGIYAGSKNKGGAWEFVESLLGDAYQNGSNFLENPGLPIRDSLLKKKVEEAKKESLHVNGRDVYFMDSELLIIEDIIYNGHFVRSQIDTDIWNVVQEEAASYFSGDKSAEDVAHIIQSRVGIMLSE